MATTQEMKERIAAVVRELSEEFGEIDDSDSLSWLDAIETRAVEIGDAVATELLQQKSANRPVQEDESTCPKCGQLGQYKGLRSRELMGRRRSPSQSTSALAVARIFFPMTRAIGVEVDCPFTPAMLRKVAYSGSQSTSFVNATKDLEALAEVKVSRERVQR